METTLIGTALGIGGAHRHDRVADTVVAGEALWAVHIRHALWWRRLACSANTTLAGRTIEVRHALLRAHANFIDAGLRWVTFRVRLALANELALEVQATLSGTAIGVEGAARVRQAEPKFTDLSVGAVSIGRAVARRNGQANTNHTSQEATGAIGIAGATIGYFAHIIDADLTGKRATSIRLTNQRRCTGACIALPSRRAIRSGRAGCGHTAAQIATLTHATIRVDIALRPRLAEEPVADCAGWAIRIRGALTEVDATPAHAREAHLAIAVGVALHRGLALP